MKTTKLIIALFMAFLTGFSSAQVSTIQLALSNGITRKPIKTSNVKVIINDTMVRHLITDEKGITGFIEVPDGKYNLSILVDPYKDYVVKNISVAGARGKHLRIRLSKA